ncbi:MAG: hypothetical protein ACLTB7_05170 [Veillonella atypica]|uniref:hypothetical protein n=1 Tax=Veillonella atypica TaxID=39777 RepID=UPI0039931E0E
MGDIQENSSLESFRYRVGLMQEWFKFYDNKNRHKDCVYFDINIFTPSWCYESNNEFILVILEELSPKKTVRRYGLGTIKDDIKTDILSINDLIIGKQCSLYSKRLGELPTDVKDKPYQFSYRNIGNYEYILIFWWLVILALDDSLYEKYLDYVADVADIFGFTETMMDDWCEATIYWLNGNEINNSATLNLKSAEGIKFFFNK